MTDKRWENKQTNILRFTNVLPLIRQEKHSLKNRDPKY